MEVSGKIFAIDEINQVSETFKKRDLILEVAENPLYPEYIKFEAVQDKTALLDKFKEGDTVEVSFNLRGRPWTDKAGFTSYFNSLVIWRINATTIDSEAPEEVSQEADENGDLPF